MECSSHADAEANLNSSNQFFSDPLSTFMHPFSSHDHDSYHYCYHHAGIMIDAKQQYPLSTEPWPARASTEILVAEEESISKKRKKRLSAMQLETLERSFQKETKLAPPIKMSLAKELNLDPRQVAVWFQNRRARHKTRELEIQYNELKLQFDTIFIEKQILQEEVLKLQALLSIQKCWNRQVSTFDNSSNIANQPPSSHASNVNLYEEACNGFYTIHGLPSVPTHYWSI